MNNQEIMNTLSQMESEIYYRSLIADVCESEDISIDNLQIFHSMIDECLTTWHRMTGLTTD